MKIRSTIGTLATLLLAALPVGWAQGGWEMRVCADPQNYPASSQEREGYDNRIAAILADELGADLEFVWTRANDNMVQSFLRPGECDLILGVNDGALELLTTVPYYRTPYVFVYRQGSPFEVRSLEDDVLRELRISTYPDSVPDRALRAAGLERNVTVHRPVAGASRTDRLTPIMDALLAGEVDVAIVYGPEASAFAQQHPDPLTIVPVSPEITLSGRQLFRTWVIGVRPGDEALRDRLDIALARRWDDIRAVFAEYGVPLASLPQPQVPRLHRPETVRIGAVLPMKTGNPAPTDTIGEAARIGAILADDLVGREVERTGIPLEVLLASAPDEGAAVRAARRLIGTEGVTALVGGLGDAQARALSRVAEEEGVLFFNIGSPADDLRGEACRRTTFHVEASAAMYLDALVGWFAHSGRRRWFLVHEATAEGEALYQRARSAVAATGGDAAVVGRAEVEPGRFTYTDDLDRVREAAPDVVLLLLPPDAQELFLAQYRFAGLEPPVTGLPFTLMQSRDYLVRLQQVLPDERSFHAALWETTLDEGGAGELNERFTSRSGEPMDPVGWAAYAAVKIAYQAVAAAGTQDPSALIRYLESPEATFDVQKGVEVSFRPWDHQLSQPLYLVSVDPEVEWGALIADKLAFADLVGDLPALYLPDVDPTLGPARLGDGPDASRCRF